ncbi:fimbrial protein [Cronobacter dublinensis]
MKYMKHLFMLCLLAGSALFMPHAHANCTSPYFPQTSYINFASVTPSTEIGDIIAGTENFFEFTVNCTEDSSDKVLVACFIGPGEEVPGMPGVYASGVPGVGVTLYNNDGKRIVGKGENCDSRNTPVYKPTSDRTFSTSVNLVLVKTSNEMGSGYFSSGTSFLFKMYNGEKLATNSTLSVTGYYTPSLVACSVDPKSLVVNLGDLPATQFTGPGYTTAWKNFDVNITCEDSASVSFRVSGTEGIADDSKGVMKLTNSPDSATGLGVQMEVNDIPIMYLHGYYGYGPISSITKTATLRSGIRYYQTASEVTPGSANATVELTIAYQ